MKFNFLEKKKFDFKYEDPDSVIRINQHKLDDLLNQGKTIDESWDKVFSGVVYPIEIRVNNEDIVNKAKEIFKQQRQGFQ